MEVFMVLVHKASYSWELRVWMGNVRFDDPNRSYRMRADGYLGSKVKDLWGSCFGSRYRPIMMIFGHFLKKVYDRLGIWRYDQLGKVHEWWFKVMLFRGLGHLARFWIDGLKYANVWNFSYNSWQLEFGAFEWEIWSLSMLKTSYVRCRIGFWGHFMCGLCFGVWRPSCAHLENYGS